MMPNETDVALLSLDSVAEGPRARKAQGCRAERAGGGKDATIVEASYHIRSCQKTATVFHA